MSLVDLLIYKSCFMSDFCMSPFFIDHVLHPLSKTQMVDFYDYQRISWNLIAFSAIVGIRKIIENYVQIFLE
jgi:hypothetical protein